jgi:hypothetical protein
MRARGIVIAVALRLVVNVRARLPCRQPVRIAPTRAEREAPSADTSSSSTMASIVARIRSRIRASSVAFSAPPTLLSLSMASSSGTRRPAGVSCGSTRRILTPFHFFHQFRDTTRCRWSSFNESIQSRHSRRRVPMTFRRAHLPALEDKLVQRAKVEVLNAIYETDFLGFLYGFRPGRSQHNALDAIYTGLLTRQVNWVLDLEIRGFFDSLDRGLLMKFIEHRIADRRVVRLIQKWLNADPDSRGESGRRFISGGPAAPRSDRRSGGSSGASALQIGRSARGG